MSISHASTDGRVVSIALAHGAGRPELALLANRQSLNLAELAGAIGSNVPLGEQVMQAARREFRWPRLRLEDAIVLLGACRLRAILLASRPEANSRRLRRPVHHNRIAPGATLHAGWQGEFQ
jgi:hypothetical protein